MKPILEITAWNGQAPERPATSRSAALSASVREILAEVRLRGDAALAEYTQRFDKVAPGPLRVPAARIAAAHAQVGADFVADLRQAIGNLERFHRAQLPQPIDLEVAPGVRCERRHVAIERVGLYVPGGTAPLPSTALMLGVPARIAGCRLRVLVSPPPIAPEILVAADLLDIGEIFEVGGAQAIAALAYGTATIPKVDKIYGPGNAWVTEAKLQVSQEAGGAALDLPAGPSEVMVLADASADPRFVAADLLSQAEHGSDSQVVLASDHRPLLEACRAEVERQLQRLPRRAIAAEALAKSALLWVADRDALLAVCNAYGPEHLILQLADARAFAAQVRHAGSVFIGPWTPESAGDYASGTNHVLPTYGFARAYGGLTTESFLKTITFQEISPRGLDALGPLVERLALAEGLHGHAAAVRVRLENRAP